MLLTPIQISTGQKSVTNKGGQYETGQTAEITVDV